VGGIGSGIFLALEGDQLLGRNESRAAHLLDVRDYCKLHIIAHYVAVLLGANPSGSPFHVVPLGKVGDDDAGRRLVEEMAAVGIDTRYVDAIEGLPTLLSVCFQYPDGDGGNITTIDSAAAHLDAAAIDRVAPLLAPDEGRGSIALVAPEVPLEVRHHLLATATARGALRVAAFTSSEIPDARRLGLFDLIDLVSMNEDEATALTGLPYDATDRQPFLDRCASVFPGRTNILVSVGKDGAFAFDDGLWEHRPAPPVPAVRNTAGAGDALLAGVLSAVAAGVPLIDRGLLRTETTDERPLTSALDLGVLLATYSVTSPHTIHPRANLEELLAFATRLGMTFSGDLLRAVEGPAGRGSGHAG
jgi:sugar/nucleoside kinase (ribokinase family)